MFGEKPLIGFHIAKIHPRFRINLPSEYKSETEETLYIIPTSNENIFILTTFEKLKEITEEDLDSIAKINYCFLKSTDVDSQKRIIIPLGVREIFKENVYLLGQNKYVIMTNEEGINDYCNKINCDVSLERKRIIPRKKQ